jgi:hypothetical protein
LHRQPEAARLAAELGLGAGLEVGRPGLLEVAQAA